MPDTDAEKLPETTATPDRERATSTPQRDPGAAGDSSESLEIRRLGQLGQDDESLMAMRRVARIRERNRLAQQRHRQKKKGEKAEIESQIDRKMHLLNASKVQLVTLKAFNARLHQRIASVSDVVSTRAPGPEAAEARGADASAGAHPSSFPIAGQLSVASGAADTHAVRGEVRTESGPPHAWAHAGASSYRHVSAHALSAPSNDPYSSQEPTNGVDIYKSLESPHLALASRSYSVGVTYKSLVDAANACTSPTAPSRGASSATSDNGAGAPQGLVATIVQVQEFERARRGCSKDDIAWYLQMPIMAAPGLPLSYTSALASPECITSMMLATIMTCIELCCCEKFMSSTAGAAAEGEVEGRTLQPGSSWQDTQTHAVGKRLKVPLRQGVVNVFKDSMSRYRDFMSPYNILKVLLVVVQRQDLVLVAAERMRVMQMMKSTVLNMQKSAQSKSEAQQGSEDPCQGLLASTANNLMGLVVLLRREVLATAQQCAGEEWSDTQDVAHRASLEEQVSERASQLHHDFILGYALVMMDASRRMYQLLFDRLSPFIKSYAVDNMNANIFIELQLSPDQRRGMAEHWRLWKQRREGISASVGTARDHLNHLPGRINLPSPVAAVLAAASEPAAAQRAREGEDEPMRYAQEAPPKRPDRPQTHERHASHTEVSPSKTVESAASSPLLLGNDPRAIAHANAALSTLRAMHKQDQRMFVENLNAHIPGVYVNAKQALKIWACGPASENVPTDFLALCQIAANQQHRHDLFGHSNEEDEGSA